MLYDNFTYSGLTPQQGWLIWLDRKFPHSHKEYIPSVIHDKHGTFYGLRKDASIKPCNTWEEAVCFASEIEIEVPEELISDINILED